MSDGKIRTRALRKSQKIEISPWLYPIKKPAIVKNLSEIKIHAYQLQTCYFFILVITKPYSEGTTQEPCLSVPVCLYGLSYLK